MRDDDLPAIRRAGLLPAVLAVEALLASQEHRGAQLWRTLTPAQLLEHLGRHGATVDQCPCAVADTGHLEAAHLASRALMVLTAHLPEEPRGAI